MGVIALALEASGIGVALWAQLRVTAGAPGREVAAWFGIAVVLFLTGIDQGRTFSFFARRDTVSKKSGTSSTPTRPTRWPDPGQLAFSLLFAGIAFATSGDTAHKPLDALTVLSLCEQTRLPAGGEFNLVNTVSWIAAVAFGLELVWQGSLWRSTAQFLRSLPRRLAQPQTFAVLGVCLVGAFFLFARLADVPLEMTSDHAEKLLDTQFILDGHRPMFLPCNTGREAMQFYLIALMAPITGLNYLTMKLGTAGLGLLALPFGYLLARHFIGSTSALLATGVMAISRWHWQVSRVGLRFPFPPLFGGMVFFTLLHALRTRRRNDFLLCGLALGIAQHTYTALRLAPIAVVLCVAIAVLHDLWRRRLDDARRLIVDTVALAFVTLLVSLPLIRYAYDQPITFLYRGVSRLTSDALDAPPDNPLAVFVGNVKNALLMFNWRGDLVWVNTIPEAPMLDAISGALFVLGSAVLLYALLRHRRLDALYIIVLLFAGLLPSILSLAYPIENPSTVRTGMAIPIVALIVALPLLVLVRQMRTLVPDSAGLPAAGVVIAGFFAGGGADQQHPIFHHLCSPAHRFLAALQHRRCRHQSVPGRGWAEEDAYLLTWAYWIDWRLVSIQTGDIKWRSISQGLDPVRLRDGIPRPRLVLVHPEDRVSLDTLRSWYPRATRREWLTEGATGTPWVVAVQIPANAIAGVAPPGAPASIAAPDTW